MRAQAKLHAIAHPPASNDNASQPLQETFDSPWRHILPRKETRLMSDEAQRTGGIFLPYPLIGFLLTLTMALVAGIVGLYSQMSALNTTMILRDSAYQQQLNEIKKTQDVQGEYVRDLRERIIKQEATSKKKG